MVICDLEGSASVAMIHAIHYADLVLIPVQPSNDDLRAAIQRPDMSCKPEKARAGPSLSESSSAGPRPASGRR